ncbi:MAG: hypothetical protein KKG47_11425 [Proteobacteria bacterium]|nr:hypothetical protein [Pseudomonadota bacterium]MBU1739425.1 hypothetical protein [Pseudomonadota bacterium]
MRAKNSQLKPAIILTSHTMGLGVIRSLGIMGVPLYVYYYDRKDMGYVSKYVREATLCPHPEKQESEFIRAILGSAEKLAGSLLIPADDATLSVVSRNKALFEKHFKVACPDWATTIKYIDKKYTYRLADQIGVPCPKTIVPENLAEVRRYSREIRFPCIVKPCESHKFFEVFGKKMTIVHSPEEMIDAYQEAADARIEVMLQEYIPGGDANGVNYNSYIHGEKTVVDFTAEKVRFSPPGIGVPRVVVSKYVPEVIEAGRKILNAIGYQGYSCTEFKKDPRDGVYKLMEINGRHNRSTLLAVRCGINFPWIEYAHYFNEDVEFNPNWKDGVYWIDELRDIIHSVKHFGEERYSFNQYIRPYLSPNVFAIFDAKDLKPFFKRLVDLMKMAAGYVLRPANIFALRPSNIKE